MVNNQQMPRDYKTERWPFRYLLVASILMWFPIDFFAHEILGLYPETILYYTSKTVVLFLVSALVYFVYRRVSNRSIVELSIISGLLSMLTFSVIYYVVLYYIYPTTIPALSPAWTLVTNIIGLNKPVLSLGTKVLEEFAVVHIVSNIVGNFVAGWIFLRSKFRVF